MTADTHPKQERTISLRVPQALADKVKTASEATNLKQSDLLRLALDRGVDVLTAQLIPLPSSVPLFAQMCSDYFKDATFGKTD